MNSKEIYPLEGNRKISKKNLAYYIDPNSGSDRSSGISSNEAWKIFENVKNLILTEGNKIEVFSPSAFRELLVLIG